MRLKISHLLASCNFLILRFCASYCTNDHITDRIDEARKRRSLLGLWCVLAHDYLTMRKPPQVHANDLLRIWREHQWCIIQYVGLTATKPFVVKRPQSRPQNSTQNIGYLANGTVVLLHLAPALSKSSKFESCRCKLRRHSQPCSCRARKSAAAADQRGIFGIKGQSRELKVRRIRRRD